MAKTPWLTLALLAAATPAFAQDPAPSVTIIGYEPTTATYGGTVTVVVDIDTQAVGDSVTLLAYGSNVAQVDDTTIGKSYVFPFSVPVMPTSYPATLTLALGPNLKAVHDLLLSVGVCYQASGSDPAWLPAGNPQQDPSTGGGTPSKVGHDEIYPDTMIPNDESVTVVGVGDDFAILAFHAFEDDGVAGSMEPVAMMEILVSTDAPGNGISTWLAGASPAWSQPGVTPGQLVTVTIPTLEAGRSYFFAARGIDEAGNVGAVSSATQATTTGIPGGGTGSGSPPSCGGTATSSAVLSMLLPLLVIFRRVRA